MQTYKLVLESAASTSFRCQKAANSLDINVAKKLRHEFNIEADITSPFGIGLIIGASGSGKTTFARHVFGDDCFNVEINLDLPVIDQFPDHMNYDECVTALLAIGLTSVPCWIKPLKTLSNGQRARAEAALALCKGETVFKPHPIVLDEWTSVVDRTVAKVMSYCINKFAKNHAAKRPIVLLSCHYDVAEWLDPDWIIDCNTQMFTDRRLLPASERKRSEQLNFQIRTIDKSSWRYFSRYHYLSDSLAGGLQKFFGLFEGNTQVGFLVFSNYVPRRPNTQFILHFNRLVIHPDYAGIGLGLRFVDLCADILIKQNFRIMGKFSSKPMFNACMKSPKWRLIGQSKIIGSANAKMFGVIRDTVRSNVQTYSFEYVQS